MLDGSLHALNCLIAYVVIATVLLLALGTVLIKRGLLRSRLEVIVWLLVSIAPAVFGWGAMAQAVLRN